MTKHVLPELDYAYDALEPVIDAQTMQLHHGKHHQGYVNGLNAAEAALAKARETGDFSNIRAIERDLAFNGAGHFNHCMFWKNMIPQKDYKDPSGTLLEHIEKDFGSFETFKLQFSKAAETVEGSGWAFLVWETNLKRLTTIAVENHQRNFPPTVIPLLALDVWEHTYYLKYQNRRGEFINNWWSIVNWEDVAKRFVKAISE